MTRLFQTLAGTTALQGTPVDPTSAGGSLIDLASEVVGLLPPASVLIARQEIVTAQSVVNADVNLSDTLNFLPIAPESVILARNGKVVPQVLDYTITGQTIKWLALTGTAADLLITDELIAQYFSAPS